MALLPSPTTSDTNGAGAHGDGGPDLRTAVSLLPTPSAERAGRNRSASDGAAVRWSLDYIEKLLPAPTAQEGRKGHMGQTASERRAAGHEVYIANALAEISGIGWGEYAPAIHRWEEVMGRPAPPPTKPNSKGNPKLSDEFDEWHMGLPAGWITDVPGIAWNEVLKACGNGVLPQQCAAAVRWLLKIEAAA